MRPIRRLLGFVKRSAHRLLGKRCSAPQDTFCIFPWKHLHIAHNGEANLCSVFDGPLSQGHSPMSVHSQSLNEIWNSDEMCRIRHAMVRGQPVAGCEECYRVERSGGLSTRLGENREWEKGWLNEGRVTIDMLKSKAVADNYRLSTMPVSLELDVGNLCNLKCRMCNGYASSRIAQDPVHSQWAGVKHSPSEHWVQREDIIRNKLLRQPEQLQILKIVGGETLLVKEVKEILQHLIDTGASHHIRLQIFTNGTVAQSPWLALVEHFQTLEFKISMDGFGKYFEYVRFPAKWATLTRNIAVFRELPRTTLSAHVTVQNYNALNIVELFRYLDSIEFPFDVYPLQNPQYLRATTMPPRARQVAVERLRSYAGQDCSPGNRDTVLALAAQIEPKGDEFEVKLMRDFMLFTNDLDVSCGQNFRETHEELLALISEAGFVWTTETRYASRRPLPILT